MSVATHTSTIDNTKNDLKTQNGEANNSLSNSCIREVGNNESNYNNEFNYNNSFKNITDLAVLIPCYNEEKAIGQTIEQLRSIIESKVIPLYQNKYDTNNNSNNNNTLHFNKINNYKIFVYDNNSNDKTVEIALEHGAIVRKETNQGKGNVIRRMFREINAKCYLMVDGDNTYGLENIDKMIDKIINQDFDMVIGDRLNSNYFTNNTRHFHNFGNKIVRKFINKLFKVNYTDIMTGLRTFSYKFVKAFPILSEGFEIETEMSIYAADKRLNVSSEICDYNERSSDNPSKLNTFSDGIKVLKTIFDLFKYYKPMKFFSILSVILMLFSIGVFTPIFISFLNTGVVAKFPTLIVLVFFSVSSLLSLFTGIILQAIHRRELIDFENRIIEIENK